MWYFSLLPQWSRILFALMWLTAVVLLFVWTSKAWVFSVITAGTLLMLGFWVLQNPSNHLSWSEDQERLPVAVIDGHQVTIRNIRHTEYRGRSDFTVRWLDRHYDLNHIRTVDFIVEPFSEWRGLAHTFLSFGFDGDEYISISVEIRKEAHEQYSPFKGLFRQYELMYVIGDERDLIGLRANIRKHPVHLYPIRASRDQVRALFLDMLHRTNHLVRKPEFYNTMTNTCISNIVTHLNRLRKKPLPFDYRVLFPGYADEIALELGLIDASGSIEELRQRFLINGRSEFGNSGNWSLRIRGH